MSAGGLSYDCLSTSRKVTLPSVEMWNTNMNILGDPIKSIHTRKIDKVGDTQSILLSQENSGDRIAEMINVYARGVNPMVSVSYDNHTGKNASKLPLRPEVFRPPIIRQEQLMPLSRQPREWFYALTNPRLPEIQNQMSCNELKSSISDRKNTNEALTNLKYHELDNVDNIKPVKIKDELLNNENRNDVTLISSINPYGLEQFGEKKLYKTPLISKIDTNISKILKGDEISSRESKLVKENKLLYSAFSNCSKMNNGTIIPSNLQHKSIIETCDMLRPIAVTNEKNKNMEFYRPDSILKFTKDINQFNIQSSMNDDKYIHFDSEKKLNKEINQIEIQSSINDDKYIHFDSDKKLNKELLKTSCESAISDINNIFLNNNEEINKGIYKDSKFGTMIYSTESNPNASIVLEEKYPHFAIKEILNKDNIIVRPTSTQIWKSLDNPTKEMDSKLKVLDIETQKTSQPRYDRLEMNGKKGVKEYIPIISHSSGIYRKDLSIKYINEKPIGKINEKTPISITTNMKKEEKNNEYINIPNQTRRTLLIENLNTSNIPEMEYKIMDDYMIQSRESRSQINENKSNSSFEQIGNYIPKFNYIDQSTEMPITNDFLNVKKKAIDEYKNRYQNDIPIF